MPHALLSVYDKTGLIPLAQGLIKLGWSLLASGSTAQALKAAKIPVTLISDYTQTPELLAGRVKTLHPAIHASILARDTEIDQKTLATYGWQPIRLVVVNLYPFKDTVAKPHISMEEAIEQIDIGGVALLRAAAKNYKQVTLASTPEVYPLLLDQLTQGGPTFEQRKQWASRAFLQASQYDALIAAYLAGADTPTTLTLYPSQTLRYGENPHQKAQLYSFTPCQGPLGGELLWGKPLSYNNLSDLDVAWQTVLTFDQPSICIVKHLSPCGIATHPQLAQAFKAALDCDRVSAFGGIIASNRAIDLNTVKTMGELFIECIVAPNFEQEAFEQLKMKRPNCRLLQVPVLSQLPEVQWRSIQGGMLKQTRDQGDPTHTEWKIVTQRHPSPDEMQTLTFAWKVCQWVKSNAIVLAKNQATVGIGGGQTNRIDCVKLAIERAGPHAQGAALASDAFFPFPDSIVLAAHHGIQAIIQPGGSIKDAGVIEAANRLGISMIFTGIRHFLH
jgi:phosphoribosylaminoimidazolecarboxamide formyltransferase / IMP cyclohydrolase